MAALGSLSLNALRARRPYLFTSPPRGGSEAYSIGVCAWVFRAAVVMLQAECTQRHLDDSGRKNALMSGF